MKYISIFLLIYLAFPFSAYSFKDRMITCDSEIKDAGTEQRSICLEIGGERSTFTIIVTDGDSICDVIIYDTFKGLSVATCCEKSPILKWAFNDLKNELVNVKYKEENDYSPIFYTLSLIIDGKKIFVVSDKKQINGNRKLRNKIKQLDTCIYTIWVNELKQSYPRDNYDR